MMKRRNEMNVYVNVRREIILEMLTFIFGNKLLYILRNVLIEIQFTQIKRFYNSRLIKQQKAGVSSDLEIEKKK